ncbi:uncharacterized protein [Physcomitrium patens]|uniref:uncharacterized protein n=1 Tax=Physcomitrium patens TaxID=3218 RepID=UPI003CCD4EF1
MPSQRQKLKRRTCTHVILKRGRLTKVCEWDINKRLFHPPFLPLLGILSNGDRRGFVSSRLKKNPVTKAMIFEPGFGRRGEPRHEWFIRSDKSISSILRELQS